MKELLRLIVTSFRLTETRTASISGGAIAICDALRSIGKLEESVDLIASVSVGITQGEFYWISTT